MEIINVLRGLRRSPSTSEGGFSDRLSFGRKSKSCPKSFSGSPLPPRPPRGGSVASSKSGNGKIIENIPDNHPFHRLHPPNDQLYFAKSREPLHIEDASMVSRLLESEAACGVCPSCHVPFDKGKRRRLLDSCGHERCYACLFQSEDCPVCREGPARGQTLTSHLDQENLYTSLHNVRRGTLDRSQGGTLSRAPTFRSQPTSPHPDCLYGSLARGPSRRASLTPPAARRTAGPRSPVLRVEPSPVVGGRRNWIQRHNRRPQTVSVDDKTMSDDASSSVSSVPHALNCQAARGGTLDRGGTLRPRQDKRSTGQESGFQSSSSILSLTQSNARLGGTTNSLYDTAICTLSNSTVDKLDHPLHRRMGSTDSMASLASSLNNFQQPGASGTLGGRSSSFLGRRRHSLTKLGQDIKQSRQYFPWRSDRQIYDKDPSENAAQSIQYRPVQWFLKPLFFEVPQRDQNPKFIGRDWVYRETSSHLASDLPTNKGVLITGGPGCGKTALFLQLVQQSCFGTGHSRATDSLKMSPLATSSLYSGDLLKSQTNIQSSNLARMASSVVAYHFCQVDSSPTCLVPEWVHSLAAQLSQAPRLAAYHHLLSTNHDLRNTLSMAECIAEPEIALLKGILEPLSSLGKEFTDPCIILIDSICDAQFHRPDFGDTIADFIVKNLNHFPPWLKIVCTTRSTMKDVIKGLPFHTISLDNFDVDERVNKDMCDYISMRIEQSESIRTNITPTFKRGILFETENPETRLKNYLTEKAKGCFLFVKLILDHLEAGHLVLKSFSFNVLPKNLSEVFMLEMNLKFPTSLSFKNVSDLFSVCLASLQPFTLPELYKAVNALSVISDQSWQDFLSSYQSVADYLVLRGDETVMFFHPAFREWLMKRTEYDQKKFMCDPRNGHAAIALSTSREDTPVEIDKTLDMCHHILKAHLYRNPITEISSRDLQSYWVSLFSEDTSFSLACHRNLFSPNINVSKLLLLSGASPDQITSFHHESPVICVYAQQGFTEMVSLLLEFGADVSLCNSQGHSAVTFAAMKGNLECVRLLIENGAQVNEVDKSQVCPLVHSVRKGHLAVVEYLVSCDWGKSSNKFRDKVDLPEAVQQATVAAAATNNVVILDFLLDMSESKIDNADTLLGDTALCASTAAGQKECCETLLRRSANISIANLRGVTPLQAAAKEGHWALCDLLLNEGAKLEQTDNQGRTPLKLAASEGNLGVVELLVSHKSCNLETSDKEGVTALGYSCAQGRIEVIEFLLRKGANLNHADKIGRTALDMAAHHGDPKVVQLLLDHGAIMEHADIHGMRPIDRAIGQSKTEAVRCFLKKGAKLGPATWASAQGKPEIMLILLNKLMEDGNTLYKKQKLTDAALRYSYASKRVPKDVDMGHQKLFQQLKVHLLLNLSRCKRKLGDTAEAIQLATEVIEIQPVCFEAYHARAKANHAAGNKVAALSDLTEAVRKAPSNRELHKILLNLKLEMKTEKSDPLPGPTLVELKGLDYSSSGVCSSGERSTPDCDRNSGTSL